MTSAQRSRTMSLIRSKNTVPEIVIRKILFSRGLRYRLHSKKLPGRPDLTFSTSRVAVFIDGDYWHGYKFDSWKDKLSPYWQQKITGNIERDARNDKELKTLGWTVIRIWENEIKSDALRCADRVESTVRGASYAKHTSSEVPRLKTRQNSKSSL